MLADGSTVASVAGAFGYGSEAAFSRAFSRITGQTPGRVRRPV
jgi:AraC-like DNA-binding protein